MAVFPLLLFITDYSCFVLLDAPVLLSLTGYLFLLLPTHITQPLYIGTMLFLLELQSLLFYGAFGFTLISLTPLILFGIYLNNFFIKTPLIGYSLLITYILCNNLLLALLNGRTTDLNSYTAWQLCVTIGAMLSISLILRTTSTTSHIAR